VGKSGWKWDFRSGGLVFRGAAKVSLDVKGRLVLPVRVRDELAKGADLRLVATADPDKCALIYPIADWEQLQDQLLSLPNLNPESRWLQRLMIGYATDLEIDAHGRVLITGELREFAGLQRDAMLVGQGNHLELWDEGAWMQGALASIQPERRTVAAPLGLAELKLSAGLKRSPPEQK
jgi:MraZ protein